MDDPAGLHVVERGPIDGGGTLGQVAVLVHGSMDRASSFGRVAKRLQEWTVLSYDRRGYAGSSAAGPSDVFADQTEDLLGVLDGRTAVGVGHSLGACVVLAAAECHPELVDTAMIWEPPMSWAEWWPGAAASRNNPEPDTDPEPETDPEEAAESFMRRVVGDRIWERLPRATREQRRAEGRTLVAETRTLRRGCPYVAARITIPVLVGYGTESSWYHRRAAEELAASLPGGDLVTIAGAGHGAHLSHPGEFAALVRRALARRTA